MDTNQTTYSWCFPDEIRQLPVLCFEEEQELAHLIHFNQDEQAYQTLVKHNIKLVFSIAKHYSHTSLPFEDVVGCGLYGLSTAAWKFEPGLQAKFSSYAVPYIKSRIQEGLRSNNWILLPSSRAGRFIQLSRMANKLPLASDELLADACKVPLSAVTSWRNFPHNTLSLDAPMGEEESSSLHNQLSDDSPGPWNRIATKESNTKLLSCISRLKPREQLALNKRYGLNGEIPHDVASVCKLMKISKQRYYIIESTAFSKLKATYTSTLKT